MEKWARPLRKLPCNEVIKSFLKSIEFNVADFTKENLSKADAAIEFTGPHSAYENVKKCIGVGNSGCLRLYRLDRTTG